MAEVEALVNEDLQSLLGQPDEQFWSAVFEQDEAMPEWSNVLGIILYGDEGTVQGTSTMFLSWMSEHAAKPTDSMASRNLITVIPSDCYFIGNGGVNATLQEAMRVIAGNMNMFAREGTCGLKAVVSTIKGDWKYFKQVLNLRHYASSNKICWICTATKDMEDPFTDISPTATWRSNLFQQDPWLAKPALANLCHFSLKRVMPDLLHVWYLGIGRDLIGGVMVHLLASDCFPGRFQKGRMLAATQALKQWAKQNDKPLPKRFRFKKENLNFKGGHYAEFRAKAAHTMVVLQWLATLDLSAVAGLNENISSCLYAADFVFSVLNAARHESLYLSEEQREQISVAGQFFCSCYLHLNQQPSPTAVLVARVRPKFHLLHHCFLLTQSQKRNVAAYSCWMDEDWIKKISAIAKKVHKSSMAIHTIRRWLLGLKDKYRDLFAAQASVGTYISRHGPFPFIRHEPYCCKLLFLVWTSGMVYRALLKNKASD